MSTITLTVAKNPIRFLKPWEFIPPCTSDIPYLTLSQDQHSTNSMDISDLLKSLANIHPISVSLEEKLLKSFHDKKINKGEFILQEGNVCTSLFYLQEGLLRSFHNLGEKEITLRIMSTGYIQLSHLYTFNLL